MGYRSRFEVCFEYVADSWSGLTFALKMMQIDGQMTQNGHQNGQLRWAIARGSVHAWPTASYRMISSTFSDRAGKRTGDNDPATRTTADVTVPFLFRCFLLLRAATRLGLWPAACTRISCGFGPWGVGPSGLPRQSFDSSRLDTQASGRDR